MLNGFLKFVAGKWTNTIVSEVNPLPVVLPAGASIVVDGINGRLNNIRATNTAVSAQFARQQIYNAGSTDIIVLALNVWGGTAGTHVYSMYGVETHNASAAVANAKNSFKLGAPVSDSIEVYHYASASAIQTTGILGGGPSASIALPGTGITFGSGYIIIPAGKTLEIAIGTANVAFTINATVDVLTT